MNQQIDNQNVSAENTAGSDSPPEIFLDEPLSSLVQSWQIPNDGIDLAKHIQDRICAASATNGIGNRMTEPGDETNRLLGEMLLEMRGMRDEMSSLQREISEMRQEHTGTVPRPSTARLFPFAPPESASHRTR